MTAQQVSDAATRNTLYANATTDLNQAIKVDPKYAPAYAFRGVLSYQDGKPAQAIPDLQRYLVLVPSDDPMRSTVLDALSKATAAAKKP